MSKKKYQVIIEETISDVFYIDAENVEKARELAQRKYESGIFILAPGNLISKQMAIIEPTDTQTEWMKF